MNKRLTRLLLVVIIISIVGGAGYWGVHSKQTEADDTPSAPLTVTVTRGDVQQTVTAPGLLVGTKEVLLGTKVSGQLAEINVRPGDVVQAGQVLARLKEKPLEQALEKARLELAMAETKYQNDLAAAQLDLKIAEAELEQETIVLPDLAAAQANLTATQAELQDILAGPDENELTVAAVELRQAEIDLKQAQWDYDQVAYRGDIGAMPEAKKLEEATLQYEAKLADYHLAAKGSTAAEKAQAEAKVQQAQHDFDQAQGKQEEHKHQLAILEARVNKARLAVKSLQAGVDPLLVRAVKTAEENLKAANLVAPFTGVVVEVKAKPGEMLQEGAEVILLAETTALEVRGKVVEEDLPLVQVDQPVEVFFDAAPDATVHGHVARIVPQRISGEDRPLYPVYVTLDQIPSGIVSGMTADASIIIAQKSEVLRLPRALVQANAEGLAVVEVWANNQIERRQVQVGLRGDVYVEIVTGLAEGEQVVGQ